MLVVTRKIGESLVLQDDSGKEIARIYIANIDRNTARVGIKAPATVAVWRTELIEIPDGTKRTDS